MSSSFRAAALWLTLEVGKVLVYLLHSNTSGMFHVRGLLAVGREEALFVAAFLAFDLAAVAIASRFLNRGNPRIHLVSWTGYAMVSAYATANVPITRVFGSPLTASMCEAAGGALADSMARYLSASNVIAVLMVFVTAAFAPSLVRKLGRRALGPVLVTAGGIAMMGCFAPTDRLALHRDPVVTLVSTKLARLWPTWALSKVAFAAQPALTGEDEAVDLSSLSSAAKGRHVIWIILESTGARYLKPYGAAEDPMPNLTRLADEAIVFDRAHAVYPESIKGLYAMLCSFAPAPHTSASAYKASDLPCNSIASTLGHEGYASALYHSGRFAYLGMDSIVADRGYDLLADAKTLARGKRGSSFGISDMTTVQAVLQRFDTRAVDVKLFVTYMPIAGHHPYESPGEGARPFGDATEVDSYRSDLFKGDLALGALVEGLKARNVWKDTLLVIHGDHGEAFYQHEGNFAHSLFPYQENLHVPLFVVAPGIVNQSKHAPQLVSLLDIAPTIADLVGAPSDPRWQGSSALRNHPRIVRSYADHTTVKLAIINGRSKLIFDADTQRSELYDLALDPLEKNDQSLANPTKVALMRADVEAWAARQRRDVERPRGSVSK